MSGIKTNLIDLGKSFDKFKNQLRHEKESQQGQQAEEANNSKGLQLDDQREEKAGEERISGQQKVLRMPSGK